MLQIKKNKERRKKKKKTENIMRMKRASLNKNKYDNQYTLIFCYINKNVYKIYMYNYKINYINTIVW